MNPKLDTLKTENQPLKKAMSAQKTIIDSKLKEKTCSFLTVADKRSWSKVLGFM